MLAADFHIIDRKISMGYQNRKSHYKSFDVQHAIPFPWFCKDYVVLFNDITNQTISQSIDKYWKMFINIEKYWIIH